MKTLWQKVMASISNWKLRRAKKVHNFLMKKGLALEKAGKYQEAIAWYEEVLKIDAKYPAAWSFKGAALLNLERFQEARDAFQKFIEFAPPEYEKYITEAKDLVRQIDKIKGVRDKKVGREKV